MCHGTTRPMTATLSHSRPLVISPASPCMQMLLTWLIVGSIVWNDMRIGLIAPVLPEALPSLCRGHARERSGTEPDVPRVQSVTPSGRTAYRLTPWGFARWLTTMDDILHAKGWAEGADAIAERREATLWEARGGPQPASAAVPGAGTSGDAIPLAVVAATGTAATGAAASAPATTLVASNPRVTSAPSETQTMAPTAEPAARVRSGSFMPAAPARGIAPRPAHSRFKAFVANESRALVWVIPAFLVVWVLAMIICGSIWGNDNYNNWPQVRVALGRALLAFGW